MITYIKGDATQPTGQGEKIIARVVNTKKIWGAGFVLALSAKWSSPELSYWEWTEQNLTFKLGNIDIVQVENDIAVCNMLAQDGTFRPHFNEVPLRYDALRECLSKLRLEAIKRNASVHMPKIGAGLARGDWPTIEQIINEELADIEVTVYEF